MDRIVYKDNPVECQRTVVTEKENVLEALYDHVVYQDRNVEVELEKVRHMHGSSLLSGRSSSANKLTPRSATVFVCGPAAVSYCVSSCCRSWRR